GRERPRPAALRPAHPRLSENRRVDRWPQPEVRHRNRAGGVRARRLGHAGSNCRLHGRSGKSMKTPHLLPALAALGIGAAILGGWGAGVRRCEAEQIHALATPAFIRYLPDRAALQRAALAQDDLLPVYGSSELVRADPYHAGVLFRDYPTGFTIFPVGNNAICSLLHVQKLASAGTAVRGKKVGISYTAETFFEDPTVKRSWYDGNFSPVHAGELAFSVDLSPDVKRYVARRMLRYPETLDNDPLLRFALERLAD